MRRSMIGSISTLIVEKEIHLVQQHPLQILASRTNRLVPESVYKQSRLFRSRVSRQSVLRQQRDDRRWILRLTQNCGYARSHIGLMNSAHDKGVIHHIEGLQQRTVES